MRIYYFGELIDDTSKNENQENKSETNVQAPTKRLIDDVFRKETERDDNSPQHPMTPPRNNFVVRNFVHA